MRRLSPGPKRRLMPKTSKYSPDPSSYHGKILPRTRSPSHRLHSFVPHASNHKNTSASTILPKSTKVAPCRHSTGKIRTGLVKRSHSPVTELSPLYRPFEESCLSSKMISHKAKSLLTLPMVAMGEDRKYASKKIKSIEKPNKRRRSKSPLLARKMARRSRSRSPCSRRRAQLEDRKLPGEESTLPSFKTNKSAVADVRIIGPTVRGISEAARIIRSPSSGILSMPTETLYTSSSFIPFQRPVRVADGSTVLVRSHGNHSWESLNTRSIHPSPSLKRHDGPFLLLHSPAQAGYFMSASRPKTFVYKQPISPDAKQELPIQSKDCPVSNKKETKSRQCHPLTAVTFSESMEVFNRLACSFWPGPVQIFAPVRMRSPKRFDAKKEIRYPSEKPMALTSDCTSSSSSSSLNSQDSSEILKDEGNKESLNAPDAIPIFPTAALTTQCSLLGTKSEKKDTYFVGFRCPSHPLANRILTEAYATKNIQGKKKNEIKHLRGAIFGSSSCFSHCGYRQPRTAMDVCTNLLSHQHHKCEEKAERQTVYVLNGEDKREIFHVPACQFSSAESISLVINFVNRTVSIVRDGPPNKGMNSEGKVSIDSSAGITTENVKKALHVCKTDKNRRLKSKIVASVMRRWKVHEYPSC